MFENSTILITGGTGSWGNALTRELLACNPKEIRIFSRGEFNQVQMHRVFDSHPKLKFVIGDVRDYEAVWQACQDVDYVFHLAALKHVPICEFQPDEALKTNVTGTENVIHASIRQGVKKVIDVSTDKAVDPVNFYGMTKAFGEKLMIRANILSHSTRFVCIRGGNVLGTRGSVVPFFKGLMLENKDIPITSKKMTRFFLTIHEAIRLLLKASMESIGGEIFVMNMRACRILDLAKVLERNVATGPVTIKETGIRPGEKLHEVLVSHYEAPRTYRYDDQYFVILPDAPPAELTSRYAQLPAVSFDRFASDSFLMTEDEIDSMLRKAGFYS